MARPKKKVAPLGGVTPIKKINSLPGTLDIITDSDPLWELLLKRFERYAKNFGFSRVELPFVEDAAVFRSFLNKGESLASFELGGKEVALRSDLLPQVLRSYQAPKTLEAKPLSKWAFFGQTVKVSPKSQLITDVQFGFEVFGAFTHLTEAQVIGAVWELVASVGLGSIVIEVNTTGLPECQEQYAQTLTDFLKPKKYDLCDNCTEHLQVDARLILRCDELDCQAIVSEAPVILDFLENDSRKHFTDILEALEELQIPYQLNPLYVGSSGTSKTNFVVKYKNKNASAIIGEGAYHTDLTARLTGKSNQAFGFVGSLSRLYDMLKAEQVEVKIDHKNEVYLVPLGELAAKKSLRLFRDLISARVSVYDHFGNVGVKSQLKAAQDSNSPIALIMGQKEAMDEMVILRDVKSGMQEMFSYDKIVDEVKKRLGK
jgi:histidyl-tRNA synthetase